MLGNGDVWTSSPGPNGLGWVMRIDSPGEYTEAATQTHSQLCVSGPMFSGAIAAVDADTAFDSRTGLTWQRKSAPAFYSWPDALAYCELQNGQQKGDEKGWRLPNYKELATLIAEDAMPPIDTVLFPDTIMDRPYWSSSPNVAYPGRVSGIAFLDGTSDDFPS